MACVSVILPVYNGIKYLSKSVDSVLKQNFTDFEFLIIDDCSFDGSWEYLECLNDIRISIFRNEQNKGLFYNLNFLIQRSSSPIIKLWAQDDILYSNCLQEVVSFHQLHPEVGFSYTGRDYINEAGISLPVNQKDDTPSIISPMLHARIAFFTGSIAGNIANVSINTSILKSVGFFNENMRISGDFEMWVRLAKDHPVGFLRQPLLQLRNHKEQLSGQEKYFIHHFKEDIEIYSILLGYVTQQQKKEGKILLRNHKLLFYYTLMVKAFLKGDLKIAWEFCRELHRFDNIIIITYFFVKNKIFNSSQNYVSKD
jgi:glycosyltransferase involved in cell wall biosynthesis